MNEGPKYLNLDDQIEEIKTHEMKGFDRLKEYYNQTDLEPEREIKSLSEPPHELEFTQAAETIELAVEIDSTQDGMGEGLSQNHLFYLLIGIATEQLMTSIALREYPDKFLQRVKKENGDTPQWDWLKRHVLSLTDPKLSNEQQERMAKVLKLIKTHRDNLVHFGFHMKSYGIHRIEIFKALGYILDEFSKEEVELVNRLEDRRKNLEKVHTGMSLPPVEF